MSKRATMTREQAHDFALALVTTGVIADYSLVPPFKGGVTIHEFLGYPPLRFLGRCIGGIIEASAHSVRVLDDVALVEAIDRFLADPTPKRGGRYNPKQLRRARDAFVVVGAEARLLADQESTQVATFKGIVLDAQAAIFGLTRAHGETDQHLRARLRRVCRVGV